MPQLVDFRRYLSAKKTIDDRSLNRWVCQTLQRALAALDLAAALLTPPESHGHDR